LKKVFLILHTKSPNEVRANKFCTSLKKFGFQPYLVIRWAKNLPEVNDTTNKELITIGKDISSYLSYPVHFNPIWFRELEKNIKEIKPDLLIVREIILAIAVSKLGKKYNIPVIMDMAENYPEVMQGWKKYMDNPILRIIVKNLKYPYRVENASLPLMDGIITVCEEQRIRLFQEYNYPKDKIELVYNTPVLSWFDGVRIGPNIPPKIFTYNGFMTLDRNLDNLISGFAIASRENNNIKLIMAGSGETYDDLVKLTNEIGISDRVTFSGFYNQEMVKDIYSEMDIGILPYKTNKFINHTIANKFFDYMAVGKPLIVAKSTPMLRILDETQSGIAVNCDSPEIIADTILNINKFDLRKMSENGFKFSREKYNWEFDEVSLINFIEKYIKK
jgi:glycosyltransferase involved in cell wall biosynthesis